MSIQIQNALGILSSDVPTGNLLWVDQVNGVDKLARRGRMTIPFRTLSEAKEAALSGDTIIVLPGNYVDANLAKNGVNWHFMNGAKVTHPDDSIFLVDSSMSFTVTGEGAFETGNGSVLDIGSPGEDILFKCDSLKATSNFCVYLSNGNLTLQARILESDAADALIVSAGVAEIDVYRIRSDGGSGVHLIGSGVARVRAFEIISTVAPAVTYDSSGLLTIQNARLVSTWAHADGRAVYAVGGSSGITLHSCVLIVDDAADDSINAASPTFTVQIHGACTANMPKGSYVTTIPLTQSPNMFSRDEGVT